MASPPDPEHETTDEMRYECLNCGYTTTATEQPTDCAECGASMRNVGMPIE